MYHSGIYNVVASMIKEAELPVNPNARGSVTLVDQSAKPESPPAQAASSAEPAVAKAEGEQPSEVPPGSQEAQAAPAGSFEPDVSKFHPWENPYLERDPGFIAHNIRWRNLIPFISLRSRTSFRDDSAYGRPDPMVLDYLNAKRSYDGSNYYTNMHRFAKRNGLLNNYYRQVDPKKFINMYYNSKYGRGYQTKKASCLLDSILGENYMLKCSAAAPVPKPGEAPKPATPKPATPKPAEPASAPDGQPAPAPAPASAPAPAKTPAPAPADPRAPMQAYDASIEAYRSAATNPNTTAEQITTARENVNKARAAVVKAQGYGNTSSVDFRRLSGDSKYSSGVNVRGEWLTPAQYTAYKNKEAELSQAGDRKAKDNAFIWLKDQLDRASAGGQSQEWIDTPQQLAIREQNKRRLAQPRTVDPSTHWKRYGDDVTRVGDKLYVNGRPSKQLMDSARLQDMTVVTRVGPRKFGTDTYNAANRVKIQPQHQTRTWDPKAVTQETVDNLGTTLSSGNLSGIHNYLGENAGDIHTWLSRNYNTPMGKQVVNYLYSLANRGNARGTQQQIYDDVEKMLWGYRILSHPEYATFYK